MNIDEIYELARTDTYPRYKDADHNGVYVTPGVLALHRKDNKGEEYDYGRAIKDLDELVKRGEMRSTQFGYTPTDLIDMARRLSKKTKKYNFKHEVKVKKLSKKDVKRRIAPIKSTPVKSAKSTPEVDVWSDL